MWKSTVCQIFLIEINNTCYSNIAYMLTWVPLILKYDILLLSQSHTIQEADDNYRCHTLYPGKTAVMGNVFEQILLIRTNNIDFWLHKNHCAKAAHK